MSGTYDSGIYDSGTYDNPITDVPTEPPLTIFPRGPLINLSDSVPVIRIELNQSNT